MTDTTAPRRSRDERVADETLADRTLLCSAHSCPNRWAVDAGNGRLCSAHAWVGRHLWPQITQEQQDAETERARAAFDPQPEPQHFRRDPARLGAALAKLAQPKDSLTWAKRLQWCEEKRAGKLPSGQQMTEYQRWAWRHSLRHAGVALADAPPVEAAAGDQCTRCGGTGHRASHCPWADAQISDPNHADAEVDA